MLKLVVPLIFGLLAGVSGGGFFAVHTASSAHATALVTARKHGLPASPDSTQGDSAHVATEHAAGEHDSTTHVAAAHAGPDSSAAPASHAPAADTHAPESHGTPVTQVDAHKPVAPNAATTATPSGAPVAHAATDAPPDAAAEAHQRRLTKIFSTMSAKDAARVLTQMTDHDVSLIINRLSDRQAAAILAILPAPRAAALSQMHGERVGGGQ
jgi:MgtE intracellular N domain